MFEVKLGQFTGKVSVHSGAWQEPDTAQPIEFAEWIGLIKFPIKDYIATPTRGAVPNDVLGLFRATDFRRCVADESEGSIMFDAELPVYFEEDAIYIAFHILGCDDYYDVPWYSEENPMAKYSLADGVEVLRNEQPRQRRTYTYATNYDGERIHETIFPCMVNATGGLVPSSYIDDQVQESTSDRREQWMLDSGTTSHIIGQYEAKAR